MPQAPLQPLTLVGPGFYGLNKQQSSAILPPQWAVEAQNCVFDDANRLAARKGWAAVTTTPLGSADPSFASVVLLLHGNGANGGTTFTDSSSIVNTISSSGAVTTSTTSPKFGSAAVSFVASGGGAAGGTLTAPITTGGSLDIYTGNFTIDGWIKWDGTARQQIVFDYGDFVANGGIRLYINASGQLTLQASFYNGWSDLISAAALVSGAWTHFAIVRNGSAGQLYVGGVGAVTPASNWTTYSAPGSLLRIGASSNSAGGLTFQNGSIDDFRVTKGVVRYTGTFTPPTSEAGDSVTSSISFSQLFEYKPISGSNVVISAAGNKLYAGTTAPTDITGALTITADNWKFVNFNGNVYAKQTGHTLAQYTGSGSFTNVTPSAGTLPTGNEILGAFGRLWGVNSDKQTIQYSGLLDATFWTGAGAGSINLTSVWPSGADEIVALASFNNRLVVFGRKNIIFIGDPTTGSILGLNPTNMIVTDAIAGIGCIERDTVQNINGDDLVFLSSAGLHSLQRVIQERSNPKSDLSKNVRDYLLTSYNGATAGTIRSCYSPQNGFYLLSFPGQKVFCFDTRIKLDDGSWRATEWNSTIPTALVALEDGKTVYQGSQGKIFQYSGYSDNGSSYRYVYQSGWLDLGEEAANYLKILKRLTSIVFFQAGTTILFKWAFDFSTTFNSFSRTTTFNGGGSEWGLGEWGIGEYGGATTLQTLTVPGQGTGQFIKAGLEVDISGAVIATQQLELYAKTGRLA